MRARLGSSGGGHTQPIRLAPHEASEGAAAEPAGPRPRAAPGHLAPLAASRHLQHLESGIVAAAALLVAQ